MPTLEQQKKVETKQEKRPRTTDITPYDYPYQVVGKYFWAKSDAEAWSIWKKITKDNKDRLAKMAKVPTFTWSAEQNITIAERLRKNDVEPFYDYQKNADKIKDFEEVKRLYQIQNISEQQTFEAYIANMHSSDIDILNTLSSPWQKAVFLRQQSQEVEKTQEMIKNKIVSWGEIDNKHLAAIKEISDMKQKITDFIQKYNKDEQNKQLRQFVTTTKDDGQEKFIDEHIEKNFQIFFISIVF